MDELTADEWRQIAMLYMEKTRELELSILKSQLLAARKTEDGEDQ